MQLQDQFDPLTGQHKIFNGKIEVTLAGNGKGGPYTRAEVFTFDASGAAVPMPATEITNNQISYRLPPLSATLFACRR